MLMPSVALKNGCASGGSVSFPLTFSISLIGMSELLSRSAVLADYLFHNAFRHASESPESGSLLPGHTNIIESPQSGVKRRTRNVTRWRDADMVQRWAASAWLLTQKHF